MISFILLWIAIVFAVAGPVICVQLVRIADALERK